jgi:hypothetical protein
MPSPSAVEAFDRPPPDEGVFGRYRLFAKLATGGQADVFLAVARGTVGVDKLVVIKRARPDQLAAFLDEASLSLRLNHPNVVHTYEVGEEAGVHFLAMEHVEGASLKQLFDAPQSRALAPAIWLRVIADALAGLGHAHGLRDDDGKPLGVVHRDVSPHNLVVGYDGVTRLLDFGIATSRHHQPGALTGKACYLAPEQALGNVVADRRSDLFAMAVVLWELLSGRRMFDAAAPEVLRRLAHAPIPRLAEAMPGVDPELDELLARALEKDPAARFQTATEMRQAIERYLRKAGQVVRQLDVAEAMAAAFSDVRAATARKIRAAMADPARRTDELPPLHGEPQPPPAAQDVSRRGRPRGAIVMLALGTTAAAAITYVATRAPAAASACATPIRVRVMYDMTGDTKEVGTAAGKGEYDYLRAINAAGGIRGCKIDLDVQDTKYDKRASLEAFSAWKARSDWPEVSTIFVQGTPMTQALGPLAAADDKLVISTAYAGEFAAPGAAAVDVAVPSLSGAFAEASVQVRKQSPGYGNVFFQGTDYTTAARLAANFAWRQGAKRMAFFYCSKSSFCTDPVDGAKTFLGQLGGTKVGRDLFIELSDDDATVERKVLAFFAEEKAHQADHPGYELADWIWFGNTSANTAALGRAIKKANDRFGLSTRMIGNNWSVDESLYERCGDACLGFAVVQPYPLFGDPTTSGTRRMLADHATYRRIDGEPADAFQAVQYIYGRVAVGTWKLAVERVLERGQPVTGATLRAALETFHNVDIEGFATIGYTPTDHRPQSGARVTQLGPHGKMEPIGQPMALALQAGWLGW